MAAKSASGAGTPSKLSLKKKTKTRPLPAKEVSVTKKFGNIISRCLRCADLLVWYELVNNSNQPLQTHTDTQKEVYTRNICTVMIKIKLKHF